MKLPVDFVFTRASFLTTMLLAVALLTTSTRSVIAADTDLDRLAEWLTGSFDTFDQVAQDEANNTPYKHTRVVLHIVPVTIAGLSEQGRTLYIEQAEADKLDKPYRQAVYFLSRNDKGVMTNRNFRISNPAELIGAWKEPGKLKGITKDRLVAVEGCDNVFTKVDEQRFTAVTGLHNACKSTIRGATHLIAYAEITPTHQVTLDQGFDDQGQHKWGPPPGTIGHIFKKRSASALAADLQQMAQLFEGEFDNYAQAWEEKEQKVAEPHNHIHSLFARVNLPAFGDNVFYVKQYENGDPTKVYRTRLYSFVPNEKEQAIELRIYVFPDEKAVTDAHLDQSKLAGLAPEKMGYYPGCEVYWKREGERFLGYMKPNACQVVSKRSGRTIVVTDDLMLNKDEIWIRDQATDTQGNYIYGHKGNIHHKLKRVRFFDGWAALKVADTGDDKKDYEGFFKLRLHDQGQMLPLVKANGEKTKYSLQISHLVQQSSKVPVMVFKLFEEGKEQAVSYSWTNPGAERVGLNLRWFQAGFTLKK